MNIAELLGERVLIKGARSLIGASGIEEVKVLEISPSGNWVKLMNLHGNKHWRPVSDIALIEVLKQLEPAPCT